MRSHQNPRYLKTDVVQTPEGVGVVDNVIMPEEGEEMLYAVYVRALRAVLIFTESDLWQ